ncbi:MAG: hypothetical protein SV375_23090, partial [Thermodesulfobacteriota bacterium]|nr:hypothetical protein [Thermodesulfobacteriota bacterium]
LDVDSLCTDPHIELNYLKIPVDPPYLKPLERPINDLYYKLRMMIRALSVDYRSLKWTGGISM